MTNVPGPLERLRLCADEIAKTTVPFYTISEGRVYGERSGVLFRIGEKHFILTCAHAIADIYNKHNLPAYIGPLTPDSGKPIRLEDCPVLRIEKYAVDLAVIELQENVVQQLSPTNRFVSIAEMDLQAAAQPAFYLVLGFPSDGTEVGKTEHDDVKTTGLWYITMLHPGDLNPNTDYDPDIHLVLNFGKKGLGENGQPSDIPNPRGLSGCGIWRLTNQQNWDNWTSEDVKLVAIQHRYDGRRDYVMGSWVRLAIQIVWHRYEELRPAMRLVVPGR